MRLMPLVETSLSIYVLFVVTQYDFPRLGVEKVPTTGYLRGFLEGWEPYIKKAGSPEESNPGPAFKDSHVISA